VGEIFHTCPDWPWGPPSPLYNGYRIFSGGEERPERDADPSSSSSDVDYSPYGPYSLHRASVPNNKAHKFIFTRFTYLHGMERDKIYLYVFCAYNGIMKTTYAFLKGKY